MASKAVKGVHVDRDARDLMMNSSSRNSHSQVRHYQLCTAVDMYMDCNRANTQNTNHTKHSHNNSHKHSNNTTNINLYLRFGDTESATDFVTSIVNRDILEPRGRKRRVDNAHSGGRRHKRCRLAANGDGQSGQSMDDPADSTNSTNHRTESLDDRHPQHTESNAETDADSMFHGVELTDPCSQRDVSYPFIFVNGNHAERYNFVIPPSPTVSENEDDDLLSGDGRDDLQSMDSDHSVAELHRDSVRCLSLSLSPTL